MTDEIQCAECERTIKNHRWGKTKSEWFIQKDGTAYCPEHIPGWVEDWRKRQKEKK